MLLYLCSFVLLLSATNAKKDKNDDLQVHLSYLGDPTTMVVTWHSFEKPGSLPQVNYGSDPNLTNKIAIATSTEWYGPQQRFTLRATMEGLTPGATYYYKVGWLGSASKLYSFKAIDPSKPLRAAVYGDFSLKEGLSLEPLKKAAGQGQFDIVFHIGDISYDLHSNNGTTGDDFMNAIEEIAAVVPYQVIAGNHEVDNNFLHISNRFTMPANGITTDNQFWSFDIGNTHFVGLSSEYYGFNMTTQAQQQYQWLLNDFKKSGAKWIVGFMHRPMYCSSDKKKGCQKDENLVMRNGAPGLPALEPLFNNAGVDLVFWGHEHTYERSYPVFESNAFQQNKTDYYNPQTPVYIMTGAAGCHSHQLPADKIQQPYTAEMLGEYGYILLTLDGSNTLSTAFMDTSEKALDQFTLTKSTGYRPGQHFVPVL